MYEKCIIDCAIVYFWTISAIKIIVVWHILACSRKREVVAIRLVQKRKKVRNSNLWSTRDYHLIQTCFFLRNFDI